MNALVPYKAASVATDDVGCFIFVRAFTDAIMGPSVDFVLPLGASVEEIVRAIPLPPERESRRRHFRVRIGEWVVPKHLWGRVYPKAFTQKGQPVALTVELAVHGGGRRGGAGKILASLAAIALIGVSFLAPGGTFAIGGLFKAGSLSARVLAGVAAVGASLALQGLTPQPTMGSKTSAPVGAAGASNDFSPGAILPRVLGTLRITPPLVVPPFLTNSGKDQYVTAVYGLAGPHEISDLKIGDILAVEDQNISFEIRNGLPTDTPLTLLDDRTIIETQTNLRLSEHQFNDDNEDDRSLLDQTNPTNSLPRWHRFESKKDPDRFALQMVFERGLGRINSEGKNRRMGVYFRGRFRLKGETTWQRLPWMLFSGRDMDNPIRYTLALEWVDVVPSTNTSSNRWPINSSGGVISSNGDYWTGLRNESGSPAIPSDWYTIRTSGSRVYYNGVDWRDNGREICFYLDKNIYPQGQYEVEIQRSASYTMTDESIYRNVTGNWFSYATGSSGRYYIEGDQDQWPHQCAVQSVQNSWNEYPIVSDDEYNTYIAIRAKNMQLDRVTCLASGMGYRYEGGVWELGYVNSNPAAKWLEVMKGPMNSRPVPDSLIDFAVIEDWYQWCIDNNKTCNLITEGDSVFKYIQQISLCGWASPVYADKYSVAIDRRRPTYRGTVSKANATDFSWRKPFPRRAHALRVTYQDASSNYEAKEFIVYDVGYNADGTGGLKEATRFETVSYPGITNEIEARSRARLDLAWSRHRQMLHMCRTDVEYLDYRKGDKVLWETDNLGIKSSSGYIRSIEKNIDDEITALVLDRERDFSKADEDGAQRGVAIRYSDGSVVHHAVTMDDTDLHRVVFDEPFEMPLTVGGADNIRDDVSNLVIAGALDTIARDVIIWEINPAEGLTADIVAVDYLPEQMYQNFASTMQMDIIIGGVVQEQITGQATMAMEITFGGAVEPNVGETSLFMEIAFDGDLSMAGVLSSAMEAPITFSGTVDERIISRSQMQMDVAFNGTVDATTAGEIFVTDFSEYATGNTATDWTTPLGVPTTKSIVSVSGTLSGKVLRFAAAAPGTVHMEWETPGDIDDVEIYARVRVSQMDQNGVIMGVVANSQFTSNPPDASTWFAYLLGVRRWSSTDQRNIISSIQSGAGGILDSPENYTNNTWVDIRVQAHGQNLKIRRWLASGAEPATWDMEYTVVADQNRDPGKVGLYWNDTNQNLECQYFAVATNGLTAPAP